MAAKKVRLLLNKSVENLGIVGDIVKVRPGFARNFLLPHRLAEAPTPTKIERLKEAREAALAELARLRSAREELLGRMKDVAVTIKRSCNDQGILYGSVTQRDISEALQAAGYDVGIRSVRLNQTIRRVGSYHVPIQFEKDLRTEVTLNVEADRALDVEREDEMEIDEEGELVEKKKGRGPRDRAASEPSAEAAPASESPQEEKPKRARKAAAKA
jgi:large subunit ribosomal protein L9